MITLTNFTLRTALKTLPTKGNLVYEYNPFHNYRLTQDKFLYKDQFYTLSELKETFGITTNEDNTKWLDSSGNELVNEPVLYQRGSLVDFVTDQLSFGLEHPVSIIPQYSYDGSVNLILNDGINPPRLINSRFSATGKNTYEIIDRKGNNDTNIYDEGAQFDIDTSLYKRVINIPKIKYKGTSAGGNLKVGNYHFYFKLADADGNETDFIGESGLVSIFVGFSNNHSQHTGNKNENSFKSVNFRLTNIDIAYNYLYVYYSRSSAELAENFNTEYLKIDKKFTVDNLGICNINITGFENTINITAQDINFSYEIIDAAKTQATCQNMLFLGNVHKPEIPYEELKDLSLRFLPKLNDIDYPLFQTQEYEIQSTNSGYLDDKFIYNYVGYWDKEIYRLGVVYILKNGELSPVFNIRGANNINSNTKYLDIPIYNGEDRNYITYNNSTNLIINKTDKKGAELENVKGVIRFSSTKDTNTIHGIRIEASQKLTTELRKYVKGFFFVRQTRIPTILAQGFSIGIDKVSRTPCIPTADGMLARLNNLDKTYVETKDIGNVNYISEGFLTRYNYTLKAKGILGKIISTVVSALALVASFIPGIGTVASIALNTANVLVGAIATGSVSAASLISAVTSAAPAGVGVLGKITNSIGKSLDATKVASLTSTASKLVKTGSNLTKLSTTISSTTQTISQVANAIDLTMKTYDYTTTAISQIKGASYNGRDTKVPKGFKKVEQDNSRILGGDFIDRIIFKDPSKVNVQCIICPDYEVNQGYYNQIFTGNRHLIRYNHRQGVTSDAQGYSSGYLINDNRHFYFDGYKDITENETTTLNLISVPDDVKVVGMNDIKFRSRAGSAEEVWRYEQIGTKYDNNSEKSDNSDIIRGSFGAYLATDSTNLKAAKIFDIMIPNYQEANIYDYFSIRMNDNSPFEAISERIDINDQREYLVNTSNTLEIDESKGYNYDVFRGDCYICQFTHRLNRNFNDPSAPYNDEIVDENSWKSHYNPDKTEEYENINLGDVNAVQLGMWITFRIRSSYNLNIRTLDNSNVDEAQMTGHPRGYFPYQPMSTEGTYKTPESQIYNKGFSKSLSERFNSALPDVPYIKNWFGTRIMYSDIHINDAYKNGYRVFRKTRAVDYTREYGEITKLISLSSNLLIIFEHGIAIAPVNQQAIQQQSGQLVATTQVLPIAPTIISDMFGSQWADSVLKVPGISGDSVQYVYGVDAIAKKIWRTDGQKLECISDFKVQEFLNNNITLGERENTPKLGIRNIKTFYNSYKRDVLFTFYDNTYGYQEKVWNLCFNELLNKFITFYSWVPSFMENINNIPFSFNRDTSKWIAKLGTSHSSSSFADGITLTNVDFDPLAGNVIQKNINVPITYLTTKGNHKTIYCTVATTTDFIGILQLTNRVIPSNNLLYNIKYELQRDIYGNYKDFKIVPMQYIPTTDEQNMGIQKTPYYPLGTSLATQDSLFKGQYYIYGLYRDSSKANIQLCVKRDENLVNLVVNHEDTEGNIRPFNLCLKKDISQDLLTELYYRNKAGHAYSDDESNKIAPGTTTEYQIEQNWLYSLEGFVFTKDNVKEKSKETPAYRLLKSIIENNEYGDLADQIEISNYDGESTFQVCTNVKKLFVNWDSLISVVDNNLYLHGIPLTRHIIQKQSIYRTEMIHTSMPIFKGKDGKRAMLPKEQRINEDKIVKLLNIKATIEVFETNTNQNISDIYYNQKASYEFGSYESTVAVIPEWNKQFLTTDFWKHGQAGSIDIADDIYPCYWYGKQHPFEFEVVVVNDPSVHKIFTNLELVANKAKPESFHYEVIGEAYDFAKDKPNMYFRQEAMKALWQYNGCDIEYNSDFLKIQTRQQAKSADLPHTYYARKKGLNEVENYYIAAEVGISDYRHLSGGEIVYYKNRQEYRVWNHALAVDVDDMPDTSASAFGGRGLISANMRYLEDRWKVQINPLLIVYKNEYERTNKNKALCIPENSTWKLAYDGESKLPPLPLYNSPIPDVVMEKGDVAIPGYTTDDGKDNALYHLYKIDEDNQPFDASNWLDDVNIYKYNFGSAQNRKETDMRDKFIKIRIRYEGSELAVIDFLNTVYQISYA